MTTTTNLGITLVDPSQAQKEVTINQAFSCLDAMSGSLVADKDLNAPPASPVTGMVYIVGPNPTGAWTGYANALAYFDQVWRFLTPQAGMRVYVKDEAIYYQFNGVVWQAANKAFAQAAPFSPLQGVGLKAWWSFCDYQSMTFTGGKVSQWNDKSGYRNNAAQPGTSRPVWSAKGFNTTAPGATFANGNLVVTDDASIQNIFAGGGTLICSFTVTGVSGNGMLITKSTDMVGTSGYTLHHYDNSGSYKLRLTVGASSSQGNYDIGPLQYNAPYVLELSYNTSTPTVAPVFILNGVKQSVAVVSATAGTVATDSGANMILGNYVDGGTSNFNGQIGQIALFNGNNTAAFMTQMRSYIGALAGIPTVPVYTLCGQSNMVGNATCTTAAFSADPANSYGNGPLIWDGNSFTPLVAGTNNYGIDANSFGPEISFGMTQSALIGQPAYLVKYSLGATDLANNWAPTSGAQWIAMRAAFDAAIPYLAANGKIPLINAFLWTQGETDGQSATSAPAYQTNLTNFISSVKTIAFANYQMAPDFVFAISGLPNQSVTSIPYGATVTAAQQTVGSATGNCYIQTKDLGLNTDQIHYNAASAITLGQRFASAISSSFTRYIGNFSAGAPTLTLAGGGTNAVAQTANGVMYCDGTKITSGTTLTYDGKNGILFFGGATPTVAAGPSAGTSPTVALSGCNSGGKLSVTTGTSPTAGGFLATVTYSAVSPTGASVMLTPGNAAAAALTGASAVFVTANQNTFTVSAGSTALAASTAYVWYYHAIQY